MTIPVGTLPGLAPVILGKFGLRGVSDSATAVEWAEPAQNDPVAALVMLLLLFSFMGGGRSSSYSSVGGGPAISTARPIGGRRP